MHYGKIATNDIANGIGVRVSLFVSGCTNHCPGCFQPETWDFLYGKEYTNETEDFIVNELVKPQYQGLSILGGEPLNAENRKDVARLIGNVLGAYPDTIIYVWTGYTIEELFEINDPYTSFILKHIHCLIDGRYEQDKRDITLPLRGSSNQRIIYLGEN